MTSISTRPVRRLDCPRTGPEVYVLGTDGEFFVRVMSRNGTKFSTPLSRIQRPL